LQLIAKSRNYKRLGTAECGRSNAYLASRVPDVPGYINKALPMKSKKKQSTALTHNNDL
jgi:hypothetical protein